MNNDRPAKDLCRREMMRHGKTHALQLWQAIQDAVAESLALDTSR